MKNPKPLTIPEDRLPKSIAAIAALIGVEKAMILATNVKHRHFYIKKTFDPRSKLVALIGRPAAFTLYRHYAGELIHLGTGKAAKQQELRAKRHASIIRAAAKGTPIREICRKFSVSKTCVYAVLSRGRRKNRPVARNCSKTQGRGV